MHTENTEGGSYYPSFEQWLYTSNVVEYLHQGDPKVRKYFQNMRKSKSKISLVKLEGMALKIRSEMINKGVSSCEDEKEFNAIQGAAKKESQQMPLICRRCGLLRAPRGRREQRLHLCCRGAHQTHRSHWRGRRLFVLLFECRVTI